jgi:glycine/D-amino acid oxidase-like deaminating enzyme
VEFAWSGNVAFTRDFFPHLGCFDGIHYAVGYCGHGVALATHLGAAVADLMLGREVRTPFREIPFPTIPLYRGRPWFLPLVGAGYRVLDWVE